MALIRLNSLPMSALRPLITPPADTTAALVSVSAVMLGAGLLLSTRSMTPNNCCRAVLLRSVLAR